MPKKSLNPFVQRSFFDRLDLRSLFKRRKKSQPLCTKVIFRLNVGKQARQAASGLNPFVQRSFFDRAKKNVKIHIKI